MLPLNRKTLPGARRALLRRWLQEDHALAKSVWLVTRKKGDPGFLPYGDIVEEALCFGWGDSLARKLGAARSMLLLSPRRAGRGWSKVNKDKAERLIRSGLMHSPGLAKFAASRMDGGWDKLDSASALIVPDDLADAFRRHPPAGAERGAFPKSARRGSHEWTLQPNRPETRARWIAETAEPAARGKRALERRKKAGEAGG